MPKRKQEAIDVSRFNVLHDNVLIKGIGIVERDGIVKPASYEDKPELGEVIGVGPGLLLEDGSRSQMTVKKGDIVYFNKYSSTRFNFDGNDFYFIHEEDVVAYQR